MKRLLLILAGFLLGIGFCNTQKQICSKVNLTEELKELCSLTPEQVVKAKPIIVEFERKRDLTYRKYRCHPLALNKAVTKNRWNYETALVGILTPAQMGLVKAFDRKNLDVMTCSCRHCHKVNYLAEAK